MGALGQHPPASLGESNIGKNPTYTQQQEFDRKDHPPLHVVTLPA